MFGATDESNSQSWNVVLQQDIGLWQYELSGNVWSVGSSTELFQGNTTFGEASLSNVRFENILARCSRRANEQTELAFGIGLTEFKASLVGDLQSWPFMSLLQSVITNRLNYRFLGSVRFWQVDAEKSLQFGSWHVLPSVSYYDVRPEIVIQSWQPTYLVFGVSNFVDNGLDVIHAGIGKLELTVGVESSFIGVNLNAAQFLPIFQFHRATKAGPQAPPSPTAKPATVSTDGGRWVRLTVKKNI